MAESSNILELVKDIGEGDEKALGRFFELYAPQLMEYILSRFGSILSQADVEDIIQEIFLSIWRTKSFRGESEQSAKNWVYAISRNEALKWIRNFRSTVDISTIEDIMPDKFDWNEIEDKIAIPNLSDQESAILRLISEGSSLNEIATKLGISIPRVAQMIDRIRTTIPSSTQWMSR